LNPNEIKNIYLLSIKNNWLQTSTSFPNFLSINTYEKKYANEQFMNDYATKIKKQLDNFPRLSRKRGIWKTNTLTLIESILHSEEIISIHSFMDYKARQDLQNELSEFLLLVRNFSPDLELESIGQAIRNYIVYAMFKQLNHRSSPLNRACLGYSMLYPFTDNYIDNTTYSKAQKLKYNQLIRDKIKGLPVKPITTHQRQTCQLLKEIETTYPRSQHKELFTLLLMMLEAQEESLKQNDTTTSISLSKRLDISLYKGGISVLIDYYFVNQNITKQDLYFYLAFGFFLQLADDLQDIEEDSKNGRQTIFTLENDCKANEHIVNKMFHFIFNIMSTYNAPNEGFKELLLSNCYQLIFMSILDSSKFFSTNYLCTMEAYLPITPTYWEVISKKKLKSQSDQLNYMKILDSLLV